REIAMNRVLSPAALVLGAVLVSPVLAEGTVPTLARNLAAACATCHGTNGTNGASQQGMPALAGREKEFLVQQMQDFKSGKRPATVMHQIARGYSDEQVETLAAYFAAQNQDSHRR
ncbi:MAG TPA: c-type cytochrome, partial [Burkholderiales bacterium]